MLPSTSPLTRISLAPWRLQERHMATLHGLPRGASSGSHAALDGMPQGGPAVLTPEHLARLLELARALSAACEHAALAKIAAERGRALTGASAAQVAERGEGGGLAVLAVATGGLLALHRRAPAPIRAGAPEHEVVRSGEPVWIGSRAGAPEGCPNLALDALAGGPGGAAWAFLPLVADGHVNGVLTLVFDEAQVFDEPTRAFLGEVAAACGNALARGSLFTRERARANDSEEARAAGEVRERRCERQVGDRTRLYERERFARARAEAETVVAVHVADDLERAQCLTAALYLAETERDVIAALVKHGVDGFGAARFELVRRGAGGALETIATAGSSPRVAEGVPSRSEGGTAEAEVLRSRAPLWLDGPALARRFPESSRALLAHGAGSWLGVPVPGGGDVDAVLSVAFPRERAFTVGDRARLAVLADECVSALSRCTARDAGAAARASALRAASAQAPGPFVVQYDETAVHGPVARILGVFSSETSAREALRELERTRSLVVHASITSWTLDVPRPRTRLEIDLPD